MATTTISPFSVEGLRGRKYHSRLSFIKEFKGETGSRAFLGSYESDGLKIFARVNIPAGKVPPRGFPVVIFAHGFSPNPSDPEYFQRPYYEEWINAYTRKGYLTIMPGYRGHGVIDGETAGGGEYIKKYSSVYLTSPFYAVDMLNFMTALPSIKELDWAGMNICLPSQNLADEKNIFLSAHSMGGDIALILLAVNQQFKAASIWAGVCAGVKDVAAFYTRYALEEKKSHKTFEVAFEEEWNNVTSAAKAEPFLLEDVNDANGFFFLQDIKTPLILHQGTGDKDVSPEWSSNLYHKLTELGKPASLHLYKDNNHELSLANGHQTAIEYDVEFFKSHFE
jgi:dipeptidyl aminopeptidase/acylaminoacyl peptidase